MGERPNGNVLVLLLLLFGIHLNNFLLIVR